MKSVVVLSGGMDSLTALARCIMLGEEVVGLNFQYGSKHNFKEFESVKKIADHYKISLKVISLDFNYYLKSDLLLSGGDIPEGHYADENMKKTVIPFRNGIMLSIAAGFAESIDADQLILGNHAGDHAIYPDCRVTFIDAMSSAIDLGTYKKIQLKSPFQVFTKGEIVKYGSKINVPYELSWSCYKGKDKHCGRCGTCVERLQAFDDAGVIDPVEYEDRSFYRQVISEFEAKN